MALDTILLAELIKETPEAAAAVVAARVVGGSALEARLQTILEAYSPLSLEYVGVKGGEYGLDVSPQTGKRELRDAARTLLGLSVPSDYDLESAPGGVRAVILRGARHF